MATNKHISTDLTTTDINEAHKAQEWVRGNQSVKIGSKTVAGVLGEIKALISGTLNLAEKGGKLSNAQTDAIIGKIRGDGFAQKYIEGLLDHENIRTKKNILAAFEMYYEIRAYLGLVSYMGNSLESHGKKCTKIKTALVTGDTSAIPQKHNGDFQEWKKELEEGKIKLETSYNMLPQVGKDRLSTNYIQWKSESDLSSITGVPNIITQEETLATTAVVQAETTPTQPLHDAANTLVTALPAASTVVKPNLMRRLVSVQATITSGTTLALEAQADTAVEAAEQATPRTQKFHDDAETLVRGLPTGATMTDLKKRLKDVQDEINTLYELNKPLTFMSALEVEQGTDDPEFEVTNAIDTEEIEFIYPSTHSRNGYEKRGFKAVGTSCDIQLENLNTTKARTLNIRVKRKKDGIEGTEMTIKIHIKAKPNAPERPDDLPDVVNFKGVGKQTIRGKLKDPSHNILVLDESKSHVAAISPTINRATGEFEFDTTADQLGLNFNGEEYFYIKIKNAKGQEETFKMKAKITGKKHKIEDLEQPDFEIPDKEIVQGKECTLPIKLKNAIMGTEVDIKITNNSGATVHSKSNIAIKGNGNITLSQLGKLKFVNDGDYEVEITYRDSHTGKQETNTQTFEVKKAPDPVALALPEGIPDTIDVTSEPFNISGKVRDKSHGVELLNEAGGSLSPAIKPVVKDDGTFSIQLPKFTAGDHTKKYKIRVSDKSGRTPPIIPVDMEITINKKIPPKANMWVIENEHDFVHKCEHVKEHPAHPEHFYINGKGQFDIEYKKKGIYGLRKDVYTAKNIPNSSGTGGSTKNIEAHSPAELYEKVQKHLKSINISEKNEYNARWGLAPETPETPEHEKPKPGDNTGPDGKDKDDGEKKGRHTETQGGHPGGNKFIGAIKTIGKTVLWPATGALSGLGYALASGGAVFLGPAIMGGAALGATGWVLKKLWDKKNGKQGGDSSKTHS